MANNPKKYAGESTLSALVTKIKELFVSKTDFNSSLSNKADKSHTHSISDTTNLQSTLDSKVPTSRTINSKPLTANITLSASDVGAASSTHSHDDKYYTETEMDAKLAAKSDTTHKHDNDYAAKTHNHDGVYAVEGHNHDDKYDSKGSASAVQASLNTVSDTLDDHTTNSDIHFTAAERTKLSGIAAGAQVNTITGVKGNSESSYRTGNVNITKANIGLGNVDNTSDANKPISTVQQLAFDEVNDAIDTHTENDDIHVTTTNKSNWNSAYTHSTSAHARTDATKVESSSTNGKIKINGTETTVYSHPNSGATAGTYKSVTVNAQGHVTSGSNPTTLAGYGITDAEAKGTASSAVSTHNTSTSAHGDIRSAITELTTKLNNFLDVDDATTDQLSELLTLIENNATDIESITSGKVNVSDIVNNLTTNVTNKPLSAAQGVAIKALIDALDLALDTHDGNTTKHITSTERTNWNTAYTHSQAAHAPSNAQANQNAFSNIAVSGQTTVAADTATDTVTFAGTNVSITTDATNDKVTFAVADGTTSAKGVVQLTNSTSSTSTTTAATPNSVKSAYDLANTAKTKADSAYTLAEGKVDSLSDLGITATATELNYMDGATSNVQTQIDELTDEFNAHTHGASDITSGIINAARLPKATDSAAGIVSTESQSFKGEKTFTSNITTVGLRANAANTADIGTSLAPFKNTNTKNLYIAPQVVGGSISHYGKFIAETTGTTSTKGVTKLEVGNFIEEGREGNSQGCIQIFNNDTGSVILETGHDDDRDIRVYLPENPGTLITSDDLSGYAKSSHNHSASNIISGTLAVERGGTGNMEGYVRAGALSGSTVGALATAEGRNTTASGSYSHAEGNYTEATGSSAHAEGQNTTASNTAAHAEGENTTASGAYSHAEGENTIASSKHQHVQGKFNKEDSAGTYAHIVGNGTGASTSSRSNAHTLDWNGNAWYAGDIYVGGISQTDSDASKVITEADQRWNLLYDSGEISAIANSISNIDVSGYTNIQVLVRIYNDGDSVGSRAGSAIFKCANGKNYQFPVWANMFSKSINTVYVMATFNLVDGWLICPYASRLIGDATTFEDTEGGTAGSLAPTGSGMMKCTSPLSTLTISSLDQNSSYYFGMGSRVMVWGWNA